MWAMCRSSSTMKLKNSLMSVISTHAQLLEQHLRSFWVPYVGQKIRKGPKSKQGVSQKRSR